MNKAATIALAGALAASGLAVSTVGANAHYWHNAHHHHHHGAGPLVAGAIFGLTIGAFASAVTAPRYPAPPPRQGYAPTPVYSSAPGRPAHSPHSDWCAAQYPSYDHSNNTWIDHQGRIQVCFSPY